MSRRWVTLLAATTLAGLLAGCGEDPTPPPIRKAPAQKTIGLLARHKGQHYFTEAAKGALDAIEGVKGVKLVYDGPEDGSPAKAAQIIEKWTKQKAAVIAAASNGSKLVTDAMASARQHGTAVIAWDMDTPAETRDLFVGPARPEEIASAMVDKLIEDLGGDPNGEVAIISTTEDSATHNAWLAAVRKRIRDKARLSVAAVKYCNDSSNVAATAARNLLTSQPKLMAIIAMSPEALDGAARAVRGESKAGKVLVTGVCGPKTASEYITDGAVSAVVAWNPTDLGYLTVKAAIALAKGPLKKGQENGTFDAGRLGPRKVENGTVMLGQLQVIDKNNVSKVYF